MGGDGSTVLIRTDSSTESAPARESFPRLHADSMSNVRADMDARYRGAIQAVLIGTLVLAPGMLGSRAPWAWALDGLLITVMVALWLLRAGAKSALRLRPTAVDLPILALLCLAALSTLASIYRYASLLDTARWLSYVLLYYVVVNNLGGREAVRTVLRAIVVLGAALSAYGMYEVVSGSEQVFWMSKTISRGLVSGTFGDAATFGGFLTLIVPLGAGAALDALGRRRWAEAAGYALCAAVTAAALIGTFNRSSWIGTAAALVVMGVIAVYRSRAGRDYRRGVLAAGFALLCIAAGTASRPVVDRVLAAFDRNGASSAARYQYVVSSLEMMRDRPVLGFGPGTFQYVWRRYRLPNRESVSADAVYTHNEYAQYGAEMGVLAPVAIIWLIAAHLRRGLRSASHRGVDWVAAALIAGPVGLAIANITYFHWHVPATALLFWAVLGLTHVWFSTERHRLP
jgi:putative inorganic carbon (hco3(-)) transporter